MNHTTSRRRFIFGVSGFLASAGLPTAASGMGGSAVGAPAPDFNLPGLDNLPIDLKSLVGKLIYLDFWASWCGPCRLSFPWMNELHDQLGDQGLHILAVNVDAKRSDAIRFLAEARPTFQVAFDPAGLTPRAYNVRAMPTSVIIDRRGVIAASHAGFSTSNAALVRREIERLLGVSR